MANKYLDDFNKTLENHPNILASNFYRGANLTPKNDKILKKKLIFSIILANSIIFYLSLLHCILDKNN